MAAIDSGLYSVYSDPPSFLRASLGSTSAPYLGANTRLSQDEVAGVSVFHVAANVNFTDGGEVFVFDGPNSEILVAATPAISGGNLALATPSAKAHSIRTVIASDGARGSIPAMLFDASAWVEEVCGQGTTLDRGLYATARTERYQMPSTRAYLDRDGALVVRPYSFPIFAISSIAIETSPGASTGLDVTQAEIAENERSVRFPVTSATSGIGTLAQQAVPPVGRGDRAYAVITYTAGVPWPGLPRFLIRATNLAAQEYLALRRNPTGAASIRQGDTMLEQRMHASGKHEATTEGVNMAQARLLLRSLMAQSV